MGKKQGTGRKEAPRSRASAAMKSARPILLDLWAGIQTIFWIIWQLLKPLGRLSWKGMKHWPFWKTVTVHGSSIAFTLVILGFFGWFSLTRAYTPDPEVDLWAINRPPSIILQTEDGDLVGTRGSHYGDPVPLEELPGYVVDTFLSTEDRRFYRHHGFDLRGFIRAAITNLRTGSMREGASTITQQLARNLFLSSERTVTRKLLELHLAFWLESHLTKDEILSLYLNRTYLGAGAYGVEAASEIYFAKSARDLTLPEAALLAGLPKAPSSLSPTSNFEGASARALEVIDNLVEARKIDRTTAELAKLAPPTLDIDDLNADFGYFVDFALIQTADILGGIDSDIVITTTIDPERQRMALEALQSAMDEEAVALGAEQAALIAFDNDARIIAMIGGISYEESQFNRATQARRQPGSAFKPFVYLAALENGINMRTLFVDQPTDVDGWRPRNYTDEYRGPMRMTEAVARSVNSVSVQASEAIGRAKVVEAAQRMGITEKLAAHPSVALGAMEVSLHDITSAYLPFARQGLSATPYTVLKVENRQGELLYEHVPTPEQQLFDEDTATNMTHLLHQVILSGTGTRARLGDRDAAGKTGTTNDWKDAWFVGYTAQITAGVWVGNDEATSMAEVTGGSLPAAIWRNFMLAAHEGVENTSIPGAFAAEAGSEKLRQREFYNGLEDDFRTTRFAAVQSGFAGNIDAFNGNGNGAGDRSDGSGEPSNDRPQGERENERPRWWPFGRRND